MVNLRIAIRGLARTPGFTVVVALSLGIGIGAVSTALSWLDAFILHPLPAVVESDRLVSVVTQRPGRSPFSLSYPRFDRWREATAGSLDIAAVTQEHLNLRTESLGPERVWGELASGNYFDVLGVRAIAGRTLTMADERSAAQVLVLSERVWDRLFARDPGLVGRQLTVNGHGFTVVGIVPARFGGSTIGLALDAWAPLTTLPLVDPGNTGLSRDGNHMLEGIARLPAGETLAAARARLEDASRRVAASLGDEIPKLAGIQLFSDTGAGRIMKPLFYTLLGLAAIILAVACATVTNLFLVRATSRGRELGVRAALGAGRAALMRQLLVESLLVAGLGGALGILLAFWGRDLLAALLPPLAFPVHLVGNVNARVLISAIALTLGVALVIGIVPALRASRPDLISTIKREGASGTPRSRLRSALVVAQVALSLTALVSAGLFFRSLTNARSADLGFRGLDRTLLAQTSFRLAGIPDSIAIGKLVQLLEGVRAVPGVTFAAASDDVPVSFSGGSSSTVRPAGYEPGPDEDLSVEYNQVSSGYFEALGIPLLRGRGFLDTDRRDSERVVVVNQAFVDRYWPGRDGIGAQINAYGADWSVVGVAPNVVVGLVGSTPGPYVYYPILQRFENKVVLVARTELDPVALVEPIRAALQTVDPNLPLLDPLTMRGRLEGALIVQSVGARLLAGLGLVALGLAALGLYGVLAFAVRLRYREIGIRMALGAASGRVVGLVVRQAAGLMVAGVVAGTGLALVVARLLRSQLFGVQPADPLTFGAVVLVLAVVAVGAAVYPARRASRVDPVVALRGE